LKSRRASAADHSALDKQLMAAIRDADSLQVQSLLEQGADANGHDEGGDTALMRAALYADTETMQALIAHGAEIHGRGLNGGTPLLRAVHDLDKARLLLEGGVRVDDLALVVAARVPGSREMLDLLFAHRGHGLKAALEFTPLMAAAGNGDLDAARCSLDHGDDVKARTPNGYTALIGAAMAGNPKMVALLLERGADPNAVCTLENGFLQTPANVAASLGHADCLRLLIAAGADVNVQGGPFEHNALLGAATTGSAETVRLLLAKADVNSRDWIGRSVLDWAARRGETAIVKMLRAAGAEPSQPPAHPTNPLPLQQKLDSESVRRSVSAALPLLQRSERTISQTRNCVTCHQHSLLAMTVGLARKHRFPVDDTIADEERAHVLKEMGIIAQPLLMGTGIDSMLSAYTLAGLAAEDVPPDRITDDLVHYLVLRQWKDGHWQTESYRPPEDSDFMFTALAIRGLQAYAPKGRSREIAERVRRAGAWLQDTHAAETTDMAFRLLGLRWAQVGDSSVEQATHALLAQQRSDGGWAQLPTLPSDAYATGLVLYALYQSGMIPVDGPAYQRGVAFLLRTQLADGSWFVQSRSFPIVEYSKSGFPHGRAQFISAAATCWATMALVATAEGKGG
jgi:ankyrin repeat protein